jgi:prepilin-type N-terminal cleavage/methylation domain-containing protein
VKNAPRGFTLVEMLIGLILLGIVSTTIYRVLTTNQRLSRAQTEQVSLQSSVRVGALAVANELREIGINSAGGTDILAMSANGITYRAMRSSGMACAVSATQVTIRNATTSPTFFSTRNIVAGQDALLLFVDSDSTISSDDSWLNLPITGVSTTTCGPDPAIALATTINTATTPLANIVLDAPVRTYEVMELGVTAVSGQNWLGVRSVSAGLPMEAALGPITANGLNLEYYTTAGGNTTTSNPALVQSIRITIRGITDRTVRAAGQSPLAVDTDSLAMRITLRNAPHP